MKQSRFIEQIIVIGEGQKMAAAIIQPNFTLKEWLPSIKWILEKLIVNMSSMKKYQNDTTGY
jgi:long-chain acyl-CoA synthetase